MASWSPEGTGGEAIAVATFSEQGKAPQIPGPLLRVPAGTVIDATVHNDLTDSTITVRGLVTRPGTGHDSLVIAPRRTARVRFAAGHRGPISTLRTWGDRTPWWSGSSSPAHW